MEKLKELLTNPFDGLTIDSFNDKCYDIAKSLFCNYYIDCNGKKYYFAEIEFYYWEKSEWNEKWNRVTYPRQCEAGELFFHLSGIDICFNSYYNENKLDEEAKFGGILIRAIRDEDNNIMAGPWNCMLKILNDSRGGNMPTIDFSQTPINTADSIKPTYRALGEIDKQEDENNSLNLCFFDSTINNWNQNKIRLKKDSGKLEYYKSHYDTKRFKSAVIPKGKGH